LRSFWACEATDAKRLKVALGSCGPSAGRVAFAEQRVIGTSLSGSDISAACSLLREAASPTDDVRGAVDCKMMLIPRLVSRAVAEARGRLANHQ